MITCGHCFDWQQQCIRLKAENARLAAHNRELRAKLTRLANGATGGHVWERVNESRIFGCLGCGSRSEVPHEILMTCEELRKHKEGGRRARYQLKGA